MNHDEIRDGDKYEVYIDDDWLVWTERTANGELLPFIMFCNEDTEECGVMPEVRSDLFDEMTGTFEVDRLDCVDGDACKVARSAEPGSDEWKKPIEVPVQVVQDGLEKHMRALTKQEVKNAL